MAVIPQIEVSNRVRLSPAPSIVVGQPPWSNIPDSTCRWKTRTFASLMRRARFCGCAHRLVCGLWRPDGADRPASRPALTTSLRSDERFGFGGRAVGDPLRVRLIQIDAGEDRSQGRARHRPIDAATGLPVHCRALPSHCKFSLPEDVFINTLTPLT